MSQDFAAACQVYYDRVYRFLLALSGDPNQAEDLTQEVFYRALLHIGSYRWLSQCRKERRRTPTLADTPQPGPEEALSAQEVQNTLRRAVAALPEDYRDVVILHIYGEISLKEISDMKGKSESWGKVTYYRARQMLKQKLEGLR